MDCLLNHNFWFIGSMLHLIGPIHELIKLFIWDLFWSFYDFYHPSPFEFLFFTQLNTFTGFIQLFMAFTVLFEEQRKCKIPISFAINTDIFTLELDEIHSIISLLQEIKIKINSRSLTFSQPGQFIQLNKNICHQWYYIIFENLVQM